ncbi:PREDICTED: cytochrome P450 4C1-like [Nicrophorus vespilloides]|uniref:Cytochrome P450 4C1-like n=1 Tax=Nicrophorus vespilloides TaxID=110193 RepID=A0ABM1MI35_NICVS|nr:PREDICTED: cytochrome P450 4C1-like [Nicrophorus vespilloides]
MRTAKQTLQSVPIMLFILIVIILGLLSLILVNRRKNNRRINEYLKDIPGPSPLPIVGNSIGASTYSKGVLRYFIDNVKKYGKTSLFWIGSNPYVFITDPKDVEILLKDTKNIRKSRTYDFLVPWLGGGLVTSTGDHWRVHRKIIRPSFNLNMLEKFVQVFNDCSDDMLENLTSKSDGERFDVFPIIVRHTLDVITETSMGLQMRIQRQEKSPYLTALESVKKISFTRVWNSLLHPDWIFDNMAIGKEFKRNLEMINDHCMKVIKEKQTIGLNDKSFLDILLSENQGEFSIKDILDEVNTFMFAGHDTTSTAIAFILHCLSLHADVQKKLYEEIEANFGAEVGTLTYRDLQSTVYLDRVIKESMRLFPPVASISRVLDYDLELTNATLPAGCYVECFIYMLHRNSKIYPDPEVFNPDRVDAEDQHHAAFAAFSAGLRNCIGQKYAMLEIKSTLIKILQRFEIYGGETISNLQNYVVLTAPDGIWMKMKPRRITS